MLVWTVVQSTIPAIEHRELLVVGVDLLIISAASCGFIVWYLDRGHAYLEADAEQQAAEHAQRVADLTQVTYRVGFQDGADEARRDAAERHLTGNLIQLDLRRPSAPQPPPGWQPPGAAWQ